MTRPGSFSSLPQYPHSQNSHDGRRPHTPPCAPTPPVDASFAIGQGVDGVTKEWLPWGLAGFIHTIILYALIPGFFMASISTNSLVSDPFWNAYDRGEDVRLWQLNAMLWGKDLLLLIIPWLYVLWMRANFYYGARKAVDGEKLEVGDFFGSTGRWGIVGVHACANLITLVGLFLFVVPGVVAALLLWAAPFIKADNPEMSVGECFKASAKAVEGNVGKTVLFLLLVGLAGVVIWFIPIVTLVAFPVLSLSHAVFIRALRARPAVRWGSAPNGPATAMPNSPRP